MKSDHTYDLAIIGGGLAGLSLAINLQKRGFEVILFEKEKYPFHRVCGEYISLESLGYLQNLGFDPMSRNCSLISHLVVSAPDGTVVEHSLNPGGFGLSRYTLDMELASIAKKSGVELMEGEKVSEIVYREGYFEIRSASGLFRSTSAAGCFGKRSNLDLKWKRKFTDKKPSKLNNYIGVKYHIRTGFDRSTIALHNFPDGYCGVSAIEDDKYCLCYLTTAANLEASGNSIERMQEEVLFRNPHLEKLFRSAEFLYEQPVTISQISFEKKTMVEDHVLMIGDAAGMITPLCGNGMSMALHAGKLAAESLDPFLKNKISRHEMEGKYIRAWEQNFSSRLRTGRMIQSLFGKPAVTSLFLKAVKPFPSLVGGLISRTHGQSF